MAVHVPGAHSWASQVSAEELRLDELDLQVLAAHPEILAALGRRRRKGPSRETLMMLLSLPALAGMSVLLPVWARGDAGRPWVEPVDFGDRAAGLAAALFAAALVAVAIVLAGWLRRGRLRAWDDELVLGVTAGGGLAALLLMAVATTADPLRPAPESWPLWLASGAALAGLGASRSASRGRRVGDARDFVVTDPVDLALAEALVAALPSRRRQGLASERRRALARLVERGMVAPEQAATLEGLPLGHSLTLGR